MKIDALTSGQSKLIGLINKQNEKLIQFDHKLSELFAQIATSKDEKNTLRCQLTSLTQHVVSLETSSPILSEDSLSDFIYR